MHPERRKRLLAKLRGILRHARGLESDETGGVRIFVGSGGFILRGRFESEFRWAYRTLLEEPGWSDTFSEQYASRKLGEVLRESVADGKSDQLEASLDRLLECCQRFDTERLVIVPLAGIRLKTRPLPLGRVTLKTMTKTEARRIRTQFRAQALKSAPKRQVISRRFADDLKTWTTDLIGAPYAEIAVVAEPKRALERAEDETRRAVDLLRYALPVLVDEIEYHAIGLAGEVHSGKRVATSIPRTYDAYTRHVAGHGRLIDVEISSTTMPKLRRIGVMKMSRVLQKPIDNVTEFEEALLRAVHWCGQGNSQTTRESQLLGLVTSLECLFTRERGQPIAASIREGVALTIARGLSRRKQVAKQVQSFYDQRSKISHGGRTSVLDSDLQELRRIVGTVIAKLIRRTNEFASRRDFHEWIQDQRLS